MPSPPADAPAVVERGRNRRSRARTALAAAPTLVRRVEGISAAVARLESRAADGRGLAAAVARIDAEVRVLPRLRDAIDDLGRRLHEAGRRDAGVRAERLAADRALLHELHAVRAQLEELRADLSLLRREHAVPSDQVRASASGRTVSSSSATPADRPTPSLRDG
jgi:chromosome segregation ATPase